MHYSIQWIIFWMAPEHYQVNLCAEKFFAIPGEIYSCYNCIGVSFEHKFAQLRMIILAVNLKIYSYFNIYYCFSCACVWVDYLMIRFTYWTKRSSSLSSFVFQHTHEREQQRLHPYKMCVRTCIRTFPFVHIISYDSIWQSEIPEKKICIRSENTI